MERTRHIFTAGTMAVLVTLTFTGCPTAQSPVDTSQRILVETGTALSHVSRAVSIGTKAQGDAAMDRAVARVRAGECDEGEDREDCAVRFLREEQAVWYQLTAALEAAHGTLETWEQANDAWRTSGARPPDWSTTVCQPFETMTQTIVELLGRVDIEVPEAWRQIITRSDDLCRLGVDLAQHLDPHQVVVGGDGGT
jgi:hypothetical protein